ncbi:MAG: hypothetical protein U1E29_07895, partial [Coriobacteriia bacterium]|nr:hypothetical protein [Coriobacteriia bacterium]
MRQFSIVGGIILLAAGTLFLLDVGGLLPFAAWQAVWPLVLVVAGGWLIYTGRRASSAPVVESASLPLGGASAASLTLRHGAGHLDVTHGAPAGTLLSGEFAGGVDVRHDLRGDLLVADLRVSSSASWIGVPTSPFDWKLNLAEGVPLDLVLEIGASENRIDLRRIFARSVRLSTGASSTTVWLPERAGHSRAEVHAGAAEVRLIVPAGVEARITSDSGLADV